MITKNYEICPDCEIGTLAGGFIPDDGTDDNYICPNCGHSFSIRKVA